MKRLAISVSSVIKLFPWAKDNEFEDFFEFPNILFVNFQGWETIYRTVTPLKIISYIYCTRATTLAQQDSNDAHLVSVRKHYRSDVKRNNLYRWGIIQSMPTPSTTNLLEQAFLDIGWNPEPLLVEMWCGIAVRVLVGRGYCYKSSRSIS